MIVKRQMRVEKLILADSSEISDEEVKEKLTTLKHKLEEPILDDLVKRIQALNFNLKHPSASRITIRLALELVGKPYDLPASSYASRITIRLADGYSEDPCCVFGALDCVKLQRKPFDHPSTSCITIRLALELAGKPYDLPASSNAKRLTIRFADGCSKGPRYVFSALDCVKLQCGPSKHPSVSRINIRLALELAGKTYDLWDSSNASRLTIRFADGCSKDPPCVFSAFDCVKLQHGPSEHPSRNRIIIRFALELADKPYDLPASSNASRLTIRLADGCSKGPCCIFCALNCVKLQRGPSEHPSASRITIRFTLELVAKPYDLPGSSNAIRITKRLADGCSESPRCIFSALNCVKSQRGPYEHPSASRITIRLALEFVDNPYDLPVSSNISRLTIRLVDGCSKGLRCVFNALDSNAKRITKRLADGCSEGPRCVFSALDCVKLQRGPFQQPSANRIIIRLALELIGKPYDLPTNSNASRLTLRLANVCSKSPRCVFSALYSVMLQRKPPEHPSASRITIRLALELAGKPYDLPACSNASQLTIRHADECSEGPRCVFSALNYVKLQREPFEHPSASGITIWVTLDLVGKPYDLPASSNAICITKRFADVCSKDPRCVFSALNYVKLQRGSFEHRSTIRITIRFALELADNPYDLPASSNANRLTIRLADGCSKDPRCIFNALNCVTLQRGPSEHPSANCITIRLALDLVGKPYDLPASSNRSRITKRLADRCSEAPRCVFSALNCVTRIFSYASRITIRLADGYSEDPCCVFGALDCVKLQRKPFDHPSTSCITIRFALELAGKPYDLPASSNAKRLTIRFADGCSKGPRYVFSALDCVKLQCGPSKHPSVSRINIRLALELAGKTYDLWDSSNASRLTIRFADGCSKDPPCVFSAFDCVKLQHGPFEHPSRNRIIIRFALELADKPYDLPASSNANRLTIRLADGCSKGPCCIFCALNCVKLQRGPSEHPSASRITIRLTLELVAKPYDLPGSSNAIRITKRLADGCSESPRCIFSALDCVKSQRGPYEHPSTSRITIRLALEFVDNPYDLPVSSNISRLTIRLVDGCSKGLRCVFNALDSNAKRITKRLADGCSEGPHCVFSALDCVKLQRGPFQQPSANRIIIRLALELIGKPYDLPTNSNASRLTLRLANVCSKSPRCVFSALYSVMLQRKPPEHPSASRITIRLALELAGKPYDLPACSNASRLTIRHADECSEGPRCVFSALNYVKLQREPFEHPSASGITIWVTLNLVGKPYDLPASSNAICITKRFVDVCSKDPRCVFSALNYVKLQRGSFEHRSTIRITIRFALELADNPYDLPASSNASRLTIRLVDGCSKDPHCILSALDCVKLQRGSFEHPSASRIIIQLALELDSKPYDLPASSNTNRLTIRLIDGCSESPCCIFSALDCVKLQRGPFEHPSASRITIRLALELANKTYDLPTSSNAIRITKRLADGCSKAPRCVFIALNCVKLQRGPYEHSSASHISIRLALEFAGNPYDLPLQLEPSEHPSASPITIRLALELAGKPYDLSASSNASRLTIRLADGCSEGPRCVFSALDCVKLQRGPYEHPSASRLTIQLALEFVGKPYDLPVRSNASRLNIRFIDGCLKGPRCVFNALEYVKSQRGSSKHSSTSRTVM
ncbi:hypothetical protein L7F22_001102 [Adiantum nelumboides]|nr:hypothetical protein [Adiantum nelumboides]